jgi:hypothetical protein
MDKAFGSPSPIYFARTHQRPNLRDRERFTRAARGLDTGAERQLLGFGEGSRSHQQGRHQPCDARCCEDHGDYDELEDACIDRTGARHEHASHDTRDPDEAERLQHVETGKQAGVDGALGIGRDCHGWGGTERQAGFDLAHMRRDVGSEAFHGLRAGVHCIGDDHASHGHQHHDVASKRSGGEHCGDRRTGPGGN